MEPVTRPDKIVTDPLVKRQLERAGIDYRFVEFTDYGKRGSGIGPFMKGYKDLKSGVRIAVASGLPMCNALGQRIEPAWTLSGGLYLAPYNLFDTTVDKARVTLVCQADQPSGVKVGAGVTYHPQLFIGGSEVHPLKDAARLLEVDPTNQNYLYNTLEWDYGVCKRRIRVIQGRFREWWIFSKKPKADVRIKHNLSGNLRLKLGSAVDAKMMSLKVLVVGDEEIIEASEFDGAVFPVQIGASLTVYPDTNAAGVDGYVSHVGVAAGWTWTTLRDGAGTDAVANTELYLALYCGTTTDLWYLFHRGLLVIDASDLPDDAIKTAAVLSLYALGRGTNGFEVDSTIVASAPASNTALAAGDYDSLGLTLFSDVLPFSDWSTTGYKAFTFTEAGRDAISLTVPSKFGWRNNTYDIANSPPAWESGVVVYKASYGIEQGTGYKAKLVITYSILFVPRVAGIV